MPKISALPPMTSAAADDEAPIVDDSASSTKKFTLTVLKEWLQSLTAWVSAAMISGIDRSLLTTDSNPYKFSAVKSSGNQAIGAGAATKVTFPTERFDTNGNYDNATNYRYTAPVAGFYLINSIVQTLRGDATTDNNLQIWKNGSLLRKGGNIKNGVYFQNQAIGLFQLAANDYIEIYFINVLATDSIEGAATSNTFEAIMMCRT